MLQQLKSFSCWCLLIALLVVPMLAHGTDIFLIEIRGTINPSTSKYLARAIEKAQEAKAQFLLMELDTPGGLVASTREMAQSIERSKIPVVVFTYPAGAAATSAGALLMISSHLAVMAPGTNIGAAHPVGLQGEDMKGAVVDKAVNDIAAFARSMAKLRQRNVTAAGEVVSKSNSYTAEEALEANLIEVMTADLNSLWKAIDKREVWVGQNKIVLNTAPLPNVHRMEMTLGEKVLNSIAHPNIAAILMTLAILLIYSELSAPGLGLGGIMGGLCLVLAFIAFQALPLRLGGLILLGAGALLIIAEIFVASGGILALGGTIALIFGLLWVIDPSATDMTISPWVLGIIGSVLGLGIMVLGWGVARLKRQSTEALRQMGGGDNAGVKGYKGRIERVAPDGRSGQVFIRGDYWNFVAQEPLQEKDVVVVDKIHGLTLEVSKEQAISDKNKEEIRSH